MDRHELDLLTRDELLGLARAAGIDGVEWLSREELVTLLARGSIPGRTRGIFDRARAFIDRARELGRTFGRASRPPEPASPPAPPTPTTPPAPPGPPPVVPAGPPGRFETLTMAEVYASQGHVREARRIAQGILARDPENAEARALLARLPEPSAEGAQDDAPAPPARYDEDVVGLVLLGPDVLYAYWEVTDTGQARARGLLGEDGHLVLRLSTATVLGLVTRDEEVAPVGDLVVHGASADARHRAAVGLVGEGGRFVPIEHSAPATTPPAGPSTDTRLEWVEVSLPPASPEIQRPEPGRATPAELRAQAEARRLLGDGGAPGNTSAGGGRS
jgi:hypothetical protein